MSDFSNPILGGSKLVREAIESENYDPGVAGWRIARNGDAEFQDGTFRGDITANSVEVGDDGDAQIRADSGDAEWTNSLSLLSFIIGDNNLPSGHTEEERGSVFQSTSPRGGSDLRAGLHPSRLADNGVSQRIPVLLLEDNSVVGPMMTLIDHTDSVDSLMFQLKADNGLEIPTMRATQQASTANDTVASSSYVHGSNGVGFTFECPPSQTVRIDVHYTLIIEPSANVLRRIFGSFEVREGSTVGSGDHVQEADDAVSVQTGSSTSGHRSDLAASTFLILPGLIEGLTYNIRTMHRLNATGSISTATDDVRRLTVTPEM